MEPTPRCQALGSDDMGGTSSWEEKSEDNIKLNAQSPVKLLKGAASLLTSRLEAIASRLQKIC